jgi:NADH:ubiquinone oxidoreductase subunit C
MTLDFKLILKYVLFKNNNFFLKSNFINDENNMIFVNKNIFYYLSLHIKLSSFFYSTQLIDVFAYEIPCNFNKKNKKNVLNNVMVYNFQNCFNQKRLFIFLNTASNVFIENKKIKNKNIKSLTELFLNANWLEREVSELNGIFFLGKKDIRNLMLQYGDSSAPFRKSYPSVGLREVYYDSVNDSLLHSPVSIQF